jgi:hypothetical protein
MESLIAPGVEPFAVAALIMGGLVAIEILSTLFGMSFSELLGKELIGDHGLLGGLLGWINPAGVPTLILILSLLAGFSASGYALQSAAEALWAPLPLIVAVPVATLAALRLSRTITRALARIIPGDETYAVAAEDLVGRVGEVTLGPLDQGPAGRVKVQDRHGNWHFPMARAARESNPIEVGTQVLLVERRSAVFLAIPASTELTTASNPKS